MIHEVERRQLTAYRRLKYSFYLSAGFNLFNNENKADAQNTAEIRSNLGFGSEIFLSNIFPKLPRLSLAVQLNYIKDGLAVTSLNNAFINEISVTGTLFWFPSALPTVVESLVPMIGIGTRVGQAKIGIKTLEEEATYSVVSFPSVTGGIRYNFKSDIGLTLLATYSEISYARLNRNKVGNLDESLKSYELNMGLNLSWNF